METIKKHILLIIIILATALRIINLASNPPSLNWDEVSMGYTSYSLLETGRDEWGEPWPILFRSYGEWKSPVYIYLIIPFIKIFGLNAWGVRLPAALFGVLAVYLTYLIGTKIYSKQIGLWSAFLLAVSPWHLMLSRPAFEAGVALTLILLGIYNFLLAFSTPKTSPLSSLIYSSFAFSLSLHTYHSAKIIVPLLLLFLLVVHRAKLTTRNMIAPVLILAIFLIPIVSDLLSGKTQKRFQQVGITTDQELVERFFKYRNTLPLGDLGNKLVLNKYTFIIAKGFSNWTSYLSPHFLLGSSSIRAQHSIPFRGVLYFVEFGLVIYGLYLLISTKRPLLNYLPIYMILTGFIPAALTKDAYHVLRSILTLPWWQVLAAIGMVELYKNKFRYLKIVNWLLIIEIFTFMATYFLWYPQAFARDWQYGHKQVAEWLSQNASKYKHIYMTKAYGEPQLFLAFYNKWDPTWYQSENKKLIEYDKLGYPWLDQLPEYTLGNYTFRDINWAVDNGKNETVYIGKGDDFWGDTPHPLSIDFPDGTAAFRVSEGK